VSFEKYPNQHVISPLGSSVWFIVLLNCY